MLPVRLLVLSVPCVASMLPVHCVCVCVYVCAHAASLLFCHVCPYFLSHIMSFCLTPWCNKLFKSNQISLSLSLSLTPCLTTVVIGRVF